MSAQYHSNSNIFTPTCKNPSRIFFANSSLISDFLSEFHSNFHPEGTPPPTFHRMTLLGHLLRKVVTIGRRSVHAQIFLFFRGPRGNLQGYPSSPTIHHVTSSRTPTSRRCIVNFKNAKIPAFTHVPSLPFLPLHISRGFRGGGRRSRVKNKICSHYPRHICMTILF